MKFNPAVMWYCLGAIKYLENLSKEEVKNVGFEIALIGQKGFDMDNPNSRYYIKTLDKELSGLQAVSYMFVAWKRINATMDIGMDFQEEYLQAKRLFEMEKSKRDNLDRDTISYLLSFDELGVNGEMDDSTILIKVVEFGGFETPRAVTIEVMRDIEMVFVTSVEFSKNMSKIDNELFQQTVQTAQKGDVGSAVKQLKELLLKYPNKSILLENIGRCYLELKKWNEAKSYYLRALEYEKNVNIHIGIANVYGNLGDLNKAIQHYEEAIVLKPDYALAYNNLAAALVEVDRKKDAEKYFLKALELEPNNPQTLFGIGLMYNRVGNRGKAEEYLQKANDNSDSMPNLKRIINETLNGLEGSIAKNKKGIQNYANKSITVPDLHEDVKLILDEVELLSGKASSL